jgi:hypothetical protein
MKRLVTFVVLLLSVALPAWAHVGSPDVFYEGNAGPYRLFVTVRVPQVIPGIAQVDVRSESPDVTSVSIAPMQLTGPGSQYPPAPDVAQRSKLDPQSFTASIWLMEFGSLQVRLQAQGSRGDGTLAVPVPAVAQTVLPMPKALGGLLLVLLLVLALSLISIAAAAVREGSLAPGANSGAGSARRNRMAAVIAAVIIAAILYVGWRWWRADASVYALNVYRPPAISAIIDPSGLLLVSAGQGSVASGNPRRAERDALDHLIPDHDHLMHLFLIRTPGLDSFWHLHPLPATGSAGKGTAEFSTALPPLPAGHYKIYADVVLSSGFPMTMVGQIDVPGNSGAALAGDDSSVLANPIPEQPSDSTVAQLPDGSQMIWERDPGPLKSNVAFSFRFRVQDASGNPVRDLQPYMGMAAHAEIARSDGSVFAHIHPSGSVAMAALDLAQSSLPNASPASGGSSKPGMNMSGMAMADENLGPEVSFPYGFPKSGVYRIFVQIKRLNRVETGVFDASVQ